MFFLPYRINRIFGTPWVTISLIVVNAIVFAGTIANIEQVAMAAGFRPDVTALYTWFTHLFLHGDIGHIGWNMYYLWLFGSVVEDAVGRWRFLALYLAGGLAAALTHTAITVLFAPWAADIPLVGASGAIAAVMGIFAVRLYRFKLSIWYFIFFRVGTFALPSLVAIGLWLGRELVFGFPALLGVTSGVANWAHIGGLLFGAAMAAGFGLVREAGTEGLAEDARTRALYGDHHAAVDAYRKLAAEQPDNPEWLLQKARELLRAGRADQLTVAADVTRGLKLLVARGLRSEAADAYVEFRSLGVEPALDRPTVQALASTCESAGQLEAAAYLYYELANGHPGTREGERSYFRLAHVYLAQGRDEMARQAWEAFLRSYPDSEWTSFADSRLGELKGGYDYRAGGAG